MIYGCKTLLRGGMHEYPNYYNFQFFLLVRFLISQRSQPSVIHQKLRKHFFLLNDDDELLVDIRKRMMNQRAASGHRTIMERDKQRRR